MADITCPKCGSLEVSKRKPSAQAFALSVLFIGIPFFFIKGKRQCFDCQNEF